MTEENDNNPQVHGSDKQGSVSDVFEYLSEHTEDPISGWAPNRASPTDLFKAIRRQIMPITLVPLIAILVGFIYSVLETPTYSSSAQLQYTVAETEAETLNATLLSHVQSIRSAEIAGKVAETGEFKNWDNVRQGRLQRTVLGLRRGLGLEEKKKLNEQERQALLIERIRENLNVRRLDDAAIVEVTYSSDTPERSAVIANLFVEAYLDDLVALRGEQAERRALFLQTRVSELEQSAIGAFQEAQILRKTGNLEFGGIDDLEERMNQLTESISNLKETEASVRARLSLLNSTDDVTLLKAAAHQAESGAALFNAFLRAQATLERIKAGGALPQSVTQIENSVVRYREELNRLIERTRNELTQELEIIAARRESVENDFANALEQSGSASWSGIRIAEHQAGVLQDLYAQHLRDLEGVYEGAVSQQFRFMAAARPGVEPSWPDYKLVLVLSAVMGILLGILIAAVREANRLSQGKTPTRRRV